MKILKTTAALLLAAALLTNFSSTAMAEENNSDNEFEQSQKQELKVECETGAYGQDVKCVAEGKQEQMQKAKLGEKVVVLKDGRVIAKAPIADTAFDFKTAAVAAGTLASGVGAAVLKLKTRI